VTHAAPTHLDYPIALRIAGRPVLVVGGGRIAEGRVRALLECGAQVRVVAPEVSTALLAWASEHSVALHQRPFEPEDLDGVAFAFTATSSPEVNRAVVTAARSRGILANAADAPELCDFTVPAVGRRGDLCIAVTSAGKSPTAAKAARDRALAAIGPEFGLLTELLGKLRPRIPRPARAKALQAIVDGGGARLLSEGDLIALFGLVRRSLRSARENA